VKVLLTGSTGLLGGALLDLLLEEGHEVRCLVREGSPRATRLNPARTEIRRGDADSARELSRALPGTEALVHVAGIEHAPSVVEAARGSQVQRLVMVGSTSAHSAYEFRSGPKRRMEEVVKGSGLDWTIVRPTMIYGSERDKNVHRLLRFLDRSPVFPIFGPGTNLWQPVFHDDCARGVYEALIRPAAIGRAYDLPGASPLPYATLVETAAHALGREPRLVRLPLEPMRRTLLLAETLRLPLPIKSEQVLRLREDKAYPLEDARRDLDYAPRSFEEGVALEVARLREIGLVKPKTP
jgi:uncharacterized protein YbjT (DUF2867 family)